MTASTVSGNSATYGVGGGIFNVRTMLTLTNSTVSGNNTEAGGGIANTGTLNLANSTISGNSAQRFAGGIANYDNTTLTNSIVANQTSREDCFNVNGVIASSGYNLDSDNTCNLTDPTDLSDGNADLGPLQNNGDTTLTHTLLPGSDAIDAGDCSGGTVTTDQRGVPRPQGVACDIGAVEFQPNDTTPPTVTIVSVTPNILSPPNGKLVPVTITGTITDADSAVDPNTASYAVTDEYNRVQPSGPVTVDADGTYTFTIHLQTSVQGNDTDGRQYLVTVSAFDHAGNEGSAATGVTVQPKKGQGRASPRVSVPQVCSSGPCDRSGFSDL